MSLTIQLKGHKSVLKAPFFPPLNLDGDYELALTGLAAWNSIPNVTENNNLFYFSDGQVIEIPVGSYEIDDIWNYLRLQLKSYHVRNPVPESMRGELGDEAIIIRGNHQTLRSEVICRYVIDFSKPKNIGSLLGFKNIILKPFKLYQSNDLVDIMQVEAIKVQCNIISGSYTNGQADHTLYEFYPSVSPGYRIIEIPRNAIYLPVNTRFIDYIELRICDQDNNLIDFRKEKIYAQIALRKCL